MGNKVDYKFVQDNSGTFDLVFDSANKDFAGIEGFDTSILMQVFLDRRSSKQQVLNPRMRQGFICDIVTKQNNYEVGSFLYLKAQARNTQAEMNEVAGYAEEAMKYFVNNKYAKKAKAVVAGNSITMTIIADGSPDNQYTLLWKALGS